MARFISRRLFLSLITLWLLVTIVFIIANVLPNDVGRTILGPFAPQESVDALNERLGTNRPIVERYVETVVGVATLDFGDSFVNGRPVLPQLADAIVRSAKLAGLALLITIPIAILAGLYAARRRDRPADRAIVLLGVTSSSIPEFVTGTVLVVVVGVQLGLLPVIATPPRDADVATQIRYLLMPATAMAIVYFGYIARMTRSGTIEVLQSDYTRTATMKGLTTSQTMRRHVLRNALIPTVAVIAVQIGYLFGGIIAVEKIFTYNGMGATMLFAARNKDIPMLTAGVIVIGIVYMVATLIADLAIAWMNPRYPPGRGTLMDIPVAPVPVAPVAPGVVSERSQARRETLLVLARRPAFIIGNIVIIGWIITAVLGDRITPYNPFDDFFVGHQPPSPEHLMGTDRLGRDVLSRVMVGSRDVLIVAPLAAILGVVTGTLLGLVMGYYRGIIDDVLSRIVEAFLALPVILVALLTLVVLGSSPVVVVFVVGILFAPIVARTVRSAVLSERQLDYVTAAKLRGESGPFILSREIFPNVLGPTVVELTVRFGYAIFTVATLSFLGVGLQPPSPDWGLSVSEEYTNMIAGVWWPTLFPALAIASTVIAVNLIADSLQSVLSE